MTNSVIFPSIMEMSVLTEKLKSINQEHLMEFWPSLSSKQKQRLYNQIASIDINLFFKQRQLITSPRNKPKDFRPLTSFSSSGEVPERTQVGTDLLKEKKLACVVLAGGQGSRLKCDGPKGLFPVSPIKKSLYFNWLLRKLELQVNLLISLFP